MKTKKASCAYQQLSLTPSLPASTYIVAEYCHHWKLAFRSIPTRKTERILVAKKSLLFVILSSGPSDQPWCAFRLGPGRHVLGTFISSRIICILHEFICDNYCIGRKSLPTRCAIKKWTFEHIWLDVTTIVVVVLAGDVSTICISHHKVAAVVMVIFIQGLRREKNSLGFPLVFWFKVKILEYWCPKLLLRAVEGVLTELTGWSSEIIVITAVPGHVRQHDQIYLSDDLNLMWGHRLLTCFTFPPSLSLRLMWRCSEQSWQRGKSRYTLAKTLCPQWTLSLSLYGWH
jgi:hypothetical protein